MSVLFNSNQNIDLVFLFIALVVYLSTRQGSTDVLLVRNSYSQVFFEIGVLKYFLIFTGKHLRLGLFLINFVKMRLQHRYFPMNIAKFPLKQIFSWNTSVGCFCFSANIVNFEHIHYICKMIFLPKMQI